MHIKSPLGILLCISLAAPLNAATFIVPPDRSMIRDTPVIVVASALASRTHLHENEAVETITLFSIEEVIKGKVDADTIELVEPGGIHDDRITIIPGVPRFRDGERYILFLTASTRGWHVRELVLGKFTFATDVMGRNVAARDAREIQGWRPNGGRHQERRRDATRFLDFVRATVAGGPAREDYFLPAEALLTPLIPHSDERTGLIPTLDAAASTYTFIVGGDRGGRWNVFPSAVNFYSVGTEPGAPGGGTTAINAAFSAWNNDPNSNVNYTYVGSTGSSSGLSAEDGINAVAFERNLTAFGVSRFQCTSNSYSGTLGIGGITRASGTHTGPGGEIFFTTLEGDVEMNQGIANCTLLFNNGDFNTAVAHEVGHTLGFRHSDQGRDQASACGGALECSNLAIMKAFIPSNINATLQTWDRNAVAAVYPGASPPPPPSSAPKATFTDDPLVPGVTVIKAIHLAELRAAVNTFRNYAGLPSASFTDPASPGIVVKAIHINELRARLDEARAALGMSTGGYTDTIAPGVIIKAVHFQEIRNRLK